MNRILLFLLVVCGLTVLGCGGGGGGGGTRALIVTTNWTNQGGPISGQSQRIELYDLQDRFVASGILSQSGGGSITLTPPSSGTYRVRAELFSLPNLEGVRTGVLDTYVTINGTTRLDTATTLSPNRVQVYPAGITLEVQRSRRYVATGFNGSTAVFVAPTSITWQALGGVATVDSEGLVLGTSAGSGSIRATHTPTGLSGSALLTVEPPTTTTSKWTILVYLNAANDLFTFSSLNVNQMERVAQNANVRFVVQWKLSKDLYPTSPFDGTRRYLVRPDTTNSIASELIQDMGDDVDMGAPQTLRDFIQWGRTYFPAERYAVVVWNHGNGWRRSNNPPPGRAVSYDDETGNAIQTWELSQALPGPKVDILAWDASLMQMLEVAYEVQDNALFVVGSEESPPGEGYPYDLIFREFRDNPDATTRQLTKAFVDGMLSVPSYESRKITQSVIDTSKLPALGAAVDALAGELIANRNDLASLIQDMRGQAQAYSPGPGRVYRDLVHLCQILEAGTAIASVDAASAAVRAAVVDALVWEGNNANSINSNGVSIDFSSASQFGPVRLDYSLTRFARDTRWDAFLDVAP